MTIKRIENVIIIKTRDNKKVIKARIIVIIFERTKLLHIANTVTTAINNISAIILFVVLKNKNFF